MKIGIIGEGAIGSYVRDNLRSNGHDLKAILVRSERIPSQEVKSSDCRYVSTTADLPAEIEHVLECAGHSALKAYGPDILRRGFDMTTVSIGALADQKLYAELENAAIEGDSRLHLASGAIGALDCLRAARIGQLQSVVYVGRKPPQGWKGSVAESRIDLDDLSVGPQCHFAGSARNAAIDYPKNANVAAAVALAGVGFEDTEVQLIADPEISENIHTIHAKGDFGSFSFEIKGRSMPDNPRSSALAAMSVISKYNDNAARISL